MACVVKRYLLIQLARLLDIVGECCYAVEHEKITMLDISSHWEFRSTKMKLDIFPTFAEQRCEMLKSHTKQQIPAICM